MEEGRNNGGRKKEGRKGGREEGRRKERVIQCVWCMGGKVKEILGVLRCTAVLVRRVRVQ